MPIIKHDTYIAVPQETCFDVARTVEAHAGKSLLTIQRAINGVTSGPMENGDWVSWETRHFWIKQVVTSQIIEMNKPYTFTDQMVRGPFQSFTHTHEFIAQDKGTTMRDTFIYTAPFGILGKVADRLFLERYMREIISIQAQKVKGIAEANYLSNLDERE